MKQMSLIEMDGFLKGKCIPSDLKVNETNAEYLVRKFGELESKLETALREFRSAGITIDNLEAKCAKMAAENTSLKQSEKEFNDFVVRSLANGKMMLLKPQPPMLSWLKLNAKQSASSLTALNTSCVTSFLRMTPKRCLRLCVFFWKNRVVSKNDNHKTTGRRNHIPH